eukprot:8451545-Pyramimonas_sp.AAC.1
MTSRQQQQFNDGPLFVDEEGVVHYNGDPSDGEEFEERAIFGYTTRAMRKSRSSTRSSSRVL